MTKKESFAWGTLIGASIVIIVIICILACMCYFGCFKSAKEAVMRKY